MNCEVAPKPTIPCVVVPSKRVTVTTYELVTTLPQNQAGYTLAHTDCCRITAVNLFAGFPVGYTFWVEITAQSQTLNNNSPSFSKPPVTALCANDVFTESMQARDSDGDQLVYSICPSNDGIVTIANRDSVNILSYHPF